MTRPELNISISPEDFENCYWLKEELTDFCRSTGINMTGVKNEIANRIKLFLATGEAVKTIVKIIPKSNFDWKDAVLNLNTKLTDNYKNTENVRAFMILHIGPHFKFNT